MKIRPAQPADYPAILELQRQNTPENLSPEQRKQGFIVSQMDESNWIRLIRIWGFWLQLMMG